MKRENYENYKWYPVTDDEYWVEENQEEFPNCNTIINYTKSRWPHDIKTYQSCSLGWGTMAKTEGYYFMIVEKSN